MFFFSICFGIGLLVGCSRRVSSKNPGAEKSGKPPDHIGDISVYECTGLRCERPKITQQVRTSRCIFVDPDVNFITFYAQILLKFCVGWFMKIHKNPNKNDKSSTSQSYFFCNFLRRTSVTLSFLAHRSRILGGWFMGLPIWDYIIISSWHEPSYANFMGVRGGRGPASQVTPIRLQKWSKNHQKHQKFTHVFASFSVGLPCIFMNHPT